MKNNEKGVTLIEVLTAVTILFIVMGIGFGLYSSIYLFYNQSKDNNINQLEETIIVDSLSRELEDPVDLYLASENELRYKTFDGKYKSVYFDFSSKSVTIYKSITEDFVHFTKDESFPLSNKVIAFKLKDETGNDQFTIQSNLLMNKIYVLSLTLEQTKSRINGTSTIVNKSVDITIKPFEMN
jgi:hypothetical protein